MSNRRYLTTFSVVIGLNLVIAIILNVLVDPFGVYRIVPDEVLGTYKHERGSCTSKAEMIQHHQRETIILGTSRVLVFDPDSEHWGPGKAYNLGLAGASFSDTFHAFRYSIDNAPIKRVFICVDFFQFSPHKLIGNDLERSRFNPDLNLLEYHLDNLVSLKATWTSIKTLTYYASNDPSVYSELGQVSRKVMINGLLTRGRVSNTVLSYARKFDVYEYSPKYLNLFRKMVKLCQQRDIELVVCVSPLHVLHWETIRATGQWETFERWKSDMVDVLAQETKGNVPLWDFGGYHQYTWEPLPGKDGSDVWKWHFETSHYKEALAELMLERLFKDSPELANFGVPVTSANLEQHLSDVQLSRELWAARSHHEIEWTLNTLGPLAKNSLTQIAKQPKQIESKRKQPLRY